MLTKDDLTDDPNWRPSDPLLCDIPNMEIVPGILVRVAVGTWGIQCGKSPLLDEKYTPLSNVRDVEPKHLPLGVVVARARDSSDKGRHIVCVFISRERRFLWFKVRDVIALAHHEHDCTW